MSQLLDLLLKPEIPNVLKKLPEKEVKVKRLSELLGQEVIFTLRALPYGRVSEIKEMSTSDISIHILLAGLVSPDLKESALLEKFGAATPAELVKAMLLPGEIEDLSRAVEKLSGFRMETIEEVKKK